MNGECYYCKRQSPLRIPKEESVDGNPVYVCDMHWNLLKNPETAIPFMKGSLAAKLRGSSNSFVLKYQSKRFFEFISNWKPTPRKDD